MTRALSVGYSEVSLYAEAKALAHQLGLDLNNDHLPRLSLEPNRLALLVEGFSPLYVEFQSSALRARTQAGKKQGLVRACKPSKGRRILDATAGWGRDSAILASFGAEVLMLERHPVMHALLLDGLKRLDGDESLASRLSLMWVDAQTYLRAMKQTDYPDVIYIDPMHPARQKSALVKKEMQVLHELIGPDEDVVGLISLAIQCVRDRVVVKWPQKLPPLAKPGLSIEGKTVRFDVYFAAK